MFFGLAIALQTSLLTDSRLEKNADFDISLQQITDFCSKASQTSGLNLRADSKIADLKVDVFVEKQPLRETLDKVAKALNCMWVPTQDGYRLEMDVPTTNRERNFVAAEEEDARKLMLIRLWACELAAKSFPGSNEYNRNRMGLLSYDVRNKILDPYQKAYQEAEKANDQNALAKAYNEYLAVTEAVGSPPNTGIGRVLLQMDKATKDRFWKGEPVAASTIPGAQYKIFPSDAYLDMSSSYVNAEGKTMQVDYPMFSFLRFDPIKGDLKASLYTFGVHPTDPNYGSMSTKSGSPYSWSSSNVGISEGVKKLPFYVDLLPWMNKEEVSKKFSQTINLQTKEWPSPWYNHRRRLGDHLRWFHQATGIPVVAQADRSCLWNWVKLKREYTTATQYIEALMGDFSTYCKEDKGFLVARNYRFWDHRRHEASEAIWQKFEPKDANTDITFDQYVSLALNLKEENISSVDIGYPLFKGDIQPVRSTYDTLRFYSLLSESQRKSAMSENGLNFQTLSTDQQDALFRLAIKLILETGSCSYELAKAIALKGFSNELIRELAFKVQVNEIKDMGNWQEEIKDGNEVVVKGGVDRGDVTQVNLSLKLGPKESVSQGLSLPKRK
jgi:hypothetical protein